MESEKANLQRKNIKASSKEPYLAIVPGKKLQDEDQKEDQPLNVQSSINEKSQKEDGKMPPA